MTAKNISQRRKNKQCRDIHAYGGILYFFHAMGDPAPGSLSAFTGGLKEDAEGADLSYQEAR